MTEFIRRILGEGGKTGHLVLVVMAVIVFCIVPSVMAWVQRAQIQKLHSQNAALQSANIELVEQIHARQLDIRRDSVIITVLAQKLRESEGDISKVLNTSVEDPDLKQEVLNFLNQQP